jgi:hypothetical protein
MALVEILVVPFLLGAVLGVVFGRGRWRFGALVALGVLLGFLFVLSAYLAAPPSSSPSDGCSDCGEYLGRWWEPGLVVSVGVFGYVAYLAGLSVGSVVRLFIPGRHGRGTPRRAG